MARWLLATIVLLAAARAGGQPMRKQDAKQPVFVAGPRLEPAAELERWFQAQKGATFRLPFTLWRAPSGGIEHAALGRVASRPAGRGLRLDDAALGIPLVERVAKLCPDRAAPCVVSLSGRFGAVLPASEVGFSVFAVWEAVAPKAELVAEIERGKSCLAIRAMKPIHCARGAKRCERCRAAEAKAPVPRLLDVCPEGEYARPTVTVVRDGKPEVRVFDVLRSFTDEAEARAFAEQHGVDDVDLSGR